MEKIKKVFLESTFFRVFSIIKKNLNIYFYTIMLDFIFLALIVLVGKYFGSLIPSDPQQLMSLFENRINLLFFIFGYPLVYYLFALFIYSITKLSILNLIRSLYEEKKFALKGLGDFYLSNVMLFAIFFFIGLILFGTSALIFEKDSLKYVVLVLMVPFLFCWYSIINISHTLFIKNEKEGIIKKGFNMAFSKLNKYGMFIIWDLVIILVYLLIYNLIHLIFRTVIFANKGVLANYGGAYINTFNIVSLIILYLIIAFNRIYFYERIDKDVL